MIRALTSLVSAARSGSAIAARFDLRAATRNSTLDRRGSSATSGCLPDSSFEEAAEDGPREARILLSLLIPSGLT